MSGNKSVSETSLVSRERVISTMARLIRNETEVTRRFTLEQLAAESGVDKRVLQSWLSHQPEQQREPKMSAALSVAVVLGRRAVNAVLATIGYVGQPLDEVEAHGPAQDAAEMLGHVTTIVKAAADNRIDHTEEPMTREAADNVIELAMPYSTRGRAA